MTACERIRKARERQDALCELNEILELELGEQPTSLEELERVGIRLVPIVEVHPTLPERVEIEVVR